MQHLIFAIVSAGLTSAPPHLDSPVYGTIQQTTLTLTGAGFGAAGPEASLFVRTRAGSISIASTDGRILSWEEDRIEMTIDESARSALVQVRTAEGESNTSRVEVYRYEWFDIPPTPGTNAVPLSLAVGADGHVWINEEFHRNFQHFDPATETVEGISPPRPPDPGPFASTIFNDHRTQTSVLGEDIMVDPDGNVWFTQGGGALYSGIHPNHSRIVRYDPDGPEGERFRVYNMPGDWNEIIGLAWDEGRQRMWVTQSSLERHPVIASFDPEMIPWDNDFDFSESLMHQVCEDEGPYEDCYRVYPLPPSSLKPAHLEVDDRGLVWYTAYWGNAIGVLDPESGAVREFPLPEAIGLGDPVWVVGCGPWQMVKAPDNGDIIFNEFFDSTIGRFDVTRILDPQCRSLDEHGVNPCIVEWITPDVDLRNERVHSIAYDLKGRLWYSIHSDEDAEVNASLGFITKDWNHIVRLPSLDGFPANAAATCDGVAVDPTTGDIYFCEFFRKRLGRLSLVE